MIIAISDTFIWQHDVLECSSPCCECDSFYSTLSFRNL